MHRESSLEDKETWILNNQLRFLMRNALQSIIPSFLIIVVFAWVSWGQTDIGKTVIWMSGGIVLAIVRLSHFFFYKFRYELKSDLWWINTYRILGFFSGSVYGAMVALFFTESPPTVQMLIMFLTVGLPAAAVGTHAVDKVTFRLFMLTIVLPSATALFLSDNSVYNGMAVLMCLFIFVMDRSAKQSAKSIFENFELTYSMSYRATHDPLVGLFNREELENQFELKAPRSNKAMALLFVDLDNFKPLNDTLGHQAGDKALVDVADIIKHAIRSDDIAARLGGDEFCIILFLNSQREAADIAKSILKGVSELTFDEEYSGLSTSVGISYHPNSDVSFSRMMRIADMACYESKEAGKNQVTLLNYGST